MRSTAAPAEPPLSASAVRAAVGAPSGGEPAGGRYTPVLEVASGGMATVWAARARSIGGFERVVALKRCHPHLAAQPAFTAMFLDEARLAAHIHHPNVVATLDVRDDDGLYLVMDYVEGEPLAALLERARESNAPMPAAVALRIGLDALAGLHAAHETCDAQGRALELIHRDVSPQNVLVGVDGVGRLIDFGVARALERAVRSGEGEVKGKLGYMPPEQLAGQPVTRRADVFAAGVLLWEALAGQRLFRADTHADTIKRVLRCEVPPLTGTASGAPGAGRGGVALEAAVRRALARSPTARFASAAEFAAAIEASGAPIASAREVAAYVAAVAGPALAARREALREALAADSRRSAALRESTAAAAAAAPQPSSLDATQVDLSSVVRSPRWRVPVAVAVASLALVALVVGVTRSPAAHESAAPRAPVAVTAVSAPVARAELPTTSAPPAAPAPPMPSAPPAASSDPATTPVTPRAHGRVAHRARRPHGGGHRPSGGATHGASAAGGGGGMYHPGGL